MSKQIEALKLAREWIGESPDRRTLSAGKMVALLTEALAEQPAQQEPVAWMKDCADFWEHYTYISEASQENYKAEAQMWVEKLRTSPQPSQRSVKPWVELTDEEIDRVWRENLHRDSRARAIDTKLREKNA